MTIPSTTRQPLPTEGAAPIMAARYVVTGKMVDVAAPLVSVEVVQAIVAMAASLGLACPACKLPTVHVDLSMATRFVAHGPVDLVAPQGVSVVGMTVIAVRV